MCFGVSLFIHESAIAVSSSWQWSAPKGYSSLRFHTRNAAPSSSSSGAARMGSAKLGWSSCTLR